jgi:hypothetical protein
VDTSGTIEEMLLFFSLRVGGLRSSGQLRTYREEQRKSSARVHLGGALSLSIGCYYYKSVTADSNKAKRCRRAKHTAQ